MDIINSTLKQINEAVLTKKISAVEVAKEYLERIKKLDSKLNSITHINENILNDAKKIDEKISKGEGVFKLAGIPFGIKAMFCTQGLHSTAGSKILENFVSPYDATVIEKIKKAGGLVIAKTNQDEFAMGSSNETSYHGNVKNPWDLARVPGGSSGGSAAAVAAKIVACALGTDTGGSIRQPANFCGIVGIKPTYGRVSRYGIIAYASSLDQAGPMANCVEDAALALEVMCGKDIKDMTSSEKPVPEFSRNLSTNLKTKKIAVIKEFTQGAINQDVQNTFDKTIQFLKNQGAEIFEVSIPLTKHAIPVYYLVAASECSSNLSRYDGVKFGLRSQFANLNIDLDEFYSQTRGEGFGEEVKRRIMLGTYCLSSGYFDAYYKKACQVRRLLRDQFIEAFKKCDALISPVTTHTAFKIGEKSTDPLAMYLNDIFTTSTNLAGLPGMSVPAGFSKEGLPIGIQLTGPHFGEQNILDIAYAIEQNNKTSSDFAQRRPHVI